jgi:hypothetical protein
LNRKQREGGTDMKSKEKKKESRRRKKLQKIQEREV